jgi:magnesium chelatase family protein
VISKVYSATIQGISPVLVEVEVSSILAETFSITIVGLPDAAVREARERLRPALRNSALREPLGIVTVNLAPADIRKEGPSFDLAIAVATLAATDQINSPYLDDYLFAGELALNGTVRPVHGALSMALCAQETGKKGIFLPAENAQEGALVSGIEVYPVESLAQLVAFLRGEAVIKPAEESFEELLNNRPETVLDFADVKGQESVKRALEIAAAGAHNLIMVGPPGTGKSMLARRLPSILPPMTLEEALEVTQIHSIMGLLKPGQHIQSERPFRSPHHTASNAGILGGGSTPTPGEITLAHHGVLFLDELPEFKRTTLETLRQPLEDGFVTISRASGTLIFPTELMLIAAMNPTPDGKMPHESRSSPQQIQNYLGRISGPLLDRIDLHIEVPSVPFRFISSNQPAAESSEQIRKRVIAARQKQTERFALSPHIRANARMGSRELSKFCNLDSDCLNLLKMAMNEMHLSARAYDRIRKVARTIADLEGSEEIQSQHIMEASQYRNLDRQVWSFLA